jgi:hypothetical protein
MPIAWGVVAQVGAEALAKALGSSIGEGLGNAFVDWLLGKKGTDGWQEVSARLERLERKIDQLTAYIVDKLPEVIYQESLEANLAVAEAEFQAYRTTVVGLLNGYKASPSEGSASDLHDAVIKVLNKAETLMRFGVPAYPVAIEAMTLATLAYAELIAKDEARYRAPLRIRAATWLGMVEEWLSPNLGTVPNTVAKYKSEYDYANQVVATYPNKVPFFLIGVMGPNTIDTTKVPPESIWYNVTNPHIYHFYDIHIGFLDRKYPNGTWTGGPGEVFWQQHLIEDAPPLAEGSWAPLLNRSPSSTGQLPIQVHWWTPLRNNTWPAGLRPEEVRDRAGVAYTQFHEQAAKLPALISEGASTVDRLTQLRDACRYFSQE